MLISVIVPHYDDLSGLDACLHRLTGQTLVGDDVEIIVADNASNCGLDAVRRVVGERARVVLVHERGAGAARNGGVADARGAVFAFTDCDCEPDVHWLAEGKHALERADVVGGRMSVVAPQNGKSGAEAFEAVFAFNNRRYVERRGFTVTANLFCRRDVFESVGGFGVGLSEDVDWCRRARKAGYKLAYCEAAICHHPARKSWDELRRKWRRITQEEFALRDCRGAPLQRLWFLMKGMLMPVSIVPHALVILTSARLSSVRERTAALITLVRIRLWRMRYSTFVALSSNPESASSKANTSLT